MFNDNQDWEINNECWEWPKNDYNGCNNARKQALEHYKKHLRLEAKMALTQSEIEMLPETNERYY